MFINIANNIIAECLPSEQNQMQWENGDLYINTEQITSINFFYNCNVGELTKNYNGLVSKYDTIEKKEVFKVCLSDKRAFFLYFGEAQHTGKYQNDTAKKQLESLFNQ